MISSPRTCPICSARLDGREVNGKTLKTAGAEVVEIPMTDGREAFSTALAARGDVHPDAGGDLRHHRRDQPSGRNSARGGRRDCADPGAVHGDDPAGQHRRPGADRPGGGLVHRGHLRADARRADGRRHRRVLPRRADALQPRRPGLPAVAGLHHSRHAGDGGVLPLRRGRGPARAVPARARRPRNHARQDRAGAGAH